MTSSTTQPTMDERDKVLLQTFGLALAEGKVLGDSVVFPPLPSACCRRSTSQLWRTKHRSQTILISSSPTGVMAGRAWVSGQRRCRSFSAFLEEMGAGQRARGGYRAPAPLQGDPITTSVRGDFRVTSSARPLGSWPTSPAVLDKMLSDNINRDFFQNDVPYEDETTDKQGRTFVTPARYPFVSSRSGSRLRCA